MVMSAKKKILLGIVIIIVISLLFTLTSPILIIGEDTSEATPGIDMAASWSIIGGFEWIYPGSSFNSQGQTLHNIHLDSPEDPYGAARDIISYTYNFTPHLIVSINNDAADGMFGSGVVDNIRSYDWGQGYDRGPASQQAMNDGGFNIFAVPIQILLGNIKFYFV